MAKGIQYCPRCGLPLGTCNCGTKKRSHPPGRKPSSFTSEEPYYSRCWYCGEPINSRRNRRCPDCGWFICSRCEACSPDCTRVQWFRSL